MALARLALLKNVQKKASPSLLMPQSRTNIASDEALMTRTLGGLQNRSMGSHPSHSQEAPKASSEEKEVAVQEGGRGRKFSLFPRRNRRRSLWRSQDRDFSPPPLPDLLPRGLGHALMQATENINRLFENINSISPFQLSGKIKEKDDHYTLKYNVPGLSKQDLKVTVHDGFLEIRGQHKEEHNKDDEDDDDEYWSEASYYNTSLLLPDDAKADEIKAELKDGVLTVVIPRTEKPRKDVKEVEIH